MDTMLKYMNAETDRKKLLPLEYERIEALQNLLRDKETDKTNAENFISKLETENKKIIDEFNEAQERIKKLEKENTELQENMIKKIKIPEIYINASSKNELQLNEQIDRLKDELEKIKSEFKEMKKSLEEEKAELNDKLYIANQKVVKLDSLEKIIRQQKKELEKLEGAEEDRKSMEKRLEIFEVDIQELNKNKQKMHEEYKKRISQLEEEKNKYKDAINSEKRNKNRIKELEEIIQSSNNNKKYWEEQCKELVENNKKLKEENDSLQSTASTKSLLLQEKVLSYKKEIEKLTNQFLTSRPSSGKLESKVAELEGKIQAAVAYKNKKEKEIESLTTKFDNLQKEHNSAIGKLEDCKKCIKNPDIVNALEKIMKEKDSLMEIASKEKETSKKYEETKIKLHKIIAENKVMKENIEEIKNQKIEVEKKLKDQIEKMIKIEKVEKIKKIEIIEDSKKQKSEVANKTKEQIDKNIEHEKEIIRLKEKIAVMQEEHNKTEKLFKELMKGSDAVFCLHIIGSKKTSC